MKIGTKERDSFNRKLQKACKEKGLKYNYSRTADNTKVSLQNQKEISISMLFYEKLPTLSFSIPWNMRIEFDDLKEALEIIVTGFVSKLQEMGKNIVAVTIKGGEFNTTSRNSLNEFFAGKSLYCVEDSYGKTQYFDAHTHSLCTQLVETAKKYRTIKNQSYFNQNAEPEARYTLDEHALPFRLRIEHDDETDRNIAIDIDLDTKKFRVFNYSKQHKNSTDFETISYEIIEENFIQFKNEERYLELLNKPKMNRSIRHHIQRVQEHSNIRDISTEQIFESMLEIYDLAEMTKKCSLNSPEVIKHDRLVQEEGVKRERRKVLETRIVTLWDVFLLFTEMIEEINGDYQTTSNFIVFETQEEAKDKLERWIIENMLP